MLAALLKKESKSLKHKSSKDSSADQPIEEKRPHREKSARGEKKKEEKVVDDVKRDNPPEEGGGVGVSDRMMGSSLQPMLGRTSMSLSQPHPVINENV